MKSSAKFGFALVATLFFHCATGVSADVYSDLAGDWRFKSEVIRTSDGIESRYNRLEGILSIDSDADDPCQLWVTQHTESRVLGIGSPGSSTFQARSVEQKCELRRFGQQILIRSRVSNDVENWSPDNFDLWFTGPSELNGKLVSALAAKVVFHRVGEDTGSLLPTLAIEERSAVQERLRRQSYILLKSSRNGAVFGLKWDDGQGLLRRFELITEGEDVWSGKPIRMTEQIYEADCQSAELFLQETKGENQNGEAVFAVSHDKTSTKGQSADPILGSPLFEALDRVCRKKTGASLARFDHPKAIEDLEGWGYTVAKIENETSVAGFREVDRKGEVIRIDYVNVAKGVREQKEYMYTRWTLDMICAVPAFHGRRQVHYDKNWKEVWSDPETAQEALDLSGDSFPATEDRAGLVHSMVCGEETR